MVRRWFAIDQPGLSAAENELCVPAKTASFNGRSHIATAPLHDSVELPSTRASTRSALSVLTSTNAADAPAIMSPALPTTARAPKRAGRRSRTRPSSRASSSEAPKKINTAPATSAAIW